MKIIITGAAGFIVRFPIVEGFPPCAGVGARYSDTPARSY
jgi:hypothetical protein